MSVAALYDIHGNLPALDAVLLKVRQQRPDLTSSAATCCPDRAATRARLRLDL
jgi:hypothetical protein